MLFSLPVGGLAQSTELENQDDMINMVYYRETAEHLLKEGVRQFEDETGYKVNLVFININKLKQVLIKGSIANSLPDVVLAPSDFVGLAPTINLSKVPSAIYNKDLMPESLGSVELEGAHYGVPVMGGNHLMLFYNKKWVKKPATSWQELQAQAIELRKKGVEPIGWNYPEMYWFMGFVGTFGGAPITDGKVSMNSQPFADGLTFYKGLADSGLISSSCNYDCAQKDFQEGRFAYVINGDWALGDFEHSLGDDLGIAVIPNIGDKPFRPLFSTVALLFPGLSLEGKKAKSLQALAQFFQEESFQGQQFSKMRFLPVNKKSFAKVKAGANQNIKMLLKQLAQGLPMSPAPMMTNAWTGMRKGFDRYMAGVLSAKEAAAYMQKFSERDYQKTRGN